VWAAGLGVVAGRSGACSCHPVPQPAAASRAAQPLLTLVWVLGDWSTARKLRAVVGGLNSSARPGLAQRDLDTGGFGGWLSRCRVFVRAVVVALAVVWLLFLRPLSFGELVVVIVVALLVTWMLEMLQRRPEETTAETPTTQATQPPTARSLA